jgi:methylmalonyl-CoA mutase N-terminal domain/subunit
MASDDTPRRTDSGIEIRPVYRAEDLNGFDPAERLGEPGQYPYTRGIHKDMYRSKVWTMRQYAGFGTAEATNERFKFLLAAGQTGLSCAFDLPTQMGYDSDAPRAEGEVGKVGVAIDSLADMRLLLAGLPLDTVTTSMTINATAAILLLLYQLVAEEQGVETDQIRGTVQNDILKEYVARGTYIYPPRPSMRLIVDTFAYCAQHLPNWNTISISGYHIREAGSTAVQEVAFTLADGIAYVEAALKAGLAVDEFAPRLSFFFNAHNNLFEEIAKFRAARRMWAHIMTERFGAKDERSKVLRFHTQTGGSTLTAQQPENNIVRVTVQSMAAALRACTRTVSTRRSACRRSGRPRSRCGPSRWWGTSRAWRTPSTRWPARTSLSRSPTKSSAGRSPTSSASTSSVAPWPPSRPATCKARSSQPPMPTRRRSMTARRSWSA